MEKQSRASSMSRAYDLTKIVYSPDDDVDGHAPAARPAEPPSEKQGERAERRGGDGEDSEEVVNVSVGQGSVVGRGGFYYYEFQVADAAGAGHLCVTHICVFFNGSEGSPESPLHAFFAAGELKF
nr:hypothetical protein CRG98_008347 [Ipomoea trifida]